MSIRNREPTNSETEHAKDRKEIAPPTIAQRIQATRIMGYIGGAVVSIGYYPDDFSKVWVPSWFGLWEYQLALFGLGLVLIA